MRIFAAEGGNIEALQWLQAKGCIWDARTCAGAARWDTLEVLEWLLDNGCPWDSSTINAAARGGHIEVLKWAKFDGCTGNMQQRGEREGFGVAARG